MFGIILLICFSKLEQVQTKIFYLEEANITITSPSFPDIYPSSSLVEWRVFVGTSTKFTMNVTELSTELSEHCKYDSLTISHFTRDDIILGPLCGNVTASTQPPPDFGYVVRFKSDDSIEYAGFSLSVTGSPIAEDIICGDMHDEKRRELKSELEETAGWYPKNLNCTWELSAPSGKQIILDFKTFNIEFSGENCLFDRFEVWNVSRNFTEEDTLLRQLCGQSYPWKFSTHSGHVRLRFISDELDNNGSFVIRYNYKAFVPPKDEIIKQILVTPEVQTNIHQGIGLKPNLLLTYKFRTHPGFGLKLLMNLWPKEGLVVYNGPDTSYKKLRLPSNGKELSTDGFHMIAEFDLSSLESALDNYNMTFITSEPIINKQAWYYLADVLRIIHEVPNTNDCAYGGLAIYEPDLRFDSLKGIFCHFQKNFINMTEMYFGAGARLVSYYYRPRINGRVNVFRLMEVKDTCRSHFLTNIAFQSDSVLRGASYHINMSLGNRRASINLEYNETVNDCIRLYFMPYSIAYAINKTRESISSDVNVDFSLSGNFPYRMCSIWSLRKAINYETSVFSKYDRMERCTKGRVNNDKRELSQELRIRGGWSLQFIRLEVGEVGSKMCAERWGYYRCQEKVATLDCGSLIMVYIEECTFKLLLFSATHYWFLKFDSMLARSSSRSLDVLEENRALKFTSSTSVPLQDMNHINGRFEYSSMINVDLTLSFFWMQQVILKFDTLPLVLTNAEGDISLRRNSNVCFDDHCYKFEKHDEPISWTSAQNKCQMSGGSLISFNTEKELRFIQKVLASDWNEQFYGNDRGLVYIGLSNLNMAREYHWVDGTPLTISDWYFPVNIYENVLPYKPSPPLNLDQIQPASNYNQRCVAMVPGNIGFSTNWRKVKCDESSYPSSVYSVCEYSKNESIGNHQDTWLNQTSGSDLTCGNEWNLINATCFALNLKSIFSLKKDTSSCVADIGGDIASMKNLNKLIVFLIATRLYVSDISFEVKYSSGETKCFSHVNGENNFMEACTGTARLHIATACERAPKSIDQRCEPYQFTCSDGSCLNPDRVCNQKQDCENNEDELNCNHAESTYICYNGQAISINNYCNFITDCSDGSDEQNCVYNSCLMTEYMCDNGQCISKSEQCDLKEDCLDGSDEINCDFETECNGFKCPISGCIPKVKVGDLIPDCPDDSQADEANVTTKADGFLCEGRLNHFRCNVGHTKCYPGSKICVYDHDTFGHLKYCRNGAHLTSCEDMVCPDMFKCPKSFCIPYHKVCDGVKDCQSGEDEVNCNNNNYPCSGRLRCGSSAQCVSLTEVCDGQIHCKTDSSDEMFCDLKKFSCPSKCSCAGYEIKCIAQQLSDIPQISITANVRVLLLQENRISLSNTTLVGFHYLAYLYLQGNGIETLPVDGFKYLRNLLVLDLSGNRIQVIPANAFVGLQNLYTLQLKGNPIHEISAGSFQGLTSLNTLDLSNMYLDEIKSGSFKGQVYLSSLFLASNNITRIYPDSFDLTNRFNILSLKDNPLETTDFEIFQKISAGTLTVPPRFCCYDQRLPTVSTCSPTPDSLLCSDLLPNISLRLSAWAMALLAVIGNIFVFVWRLSKKLPDVPSILIFNLSISDILMGVYLLTLATTDMRYRENYALRDISWRDSLTCKAMGVLGFLSCEMSMFILILIAVDRTKKLAFPFSISQLSRRTAWIFVLTGWAGSILLSIFPFILPSYFGDYYSKNSICLPFNFDDPWGKGWQFTTIIFVGLNSICITTIITLYMLVYLKIKESRERAGRHDFLEQDVARKLSVVVVTDLICMAPIIASNVIAIFGFSINRHLSAIFVSVLLPINSALNPYLFSGMSLIDNYRNKSKKRDYTTSKKTTNNRTTSSKT